MKAYRIRNWKKQFERYHTRRYESLNWVCVPINPSSESFRILMSTAQGVAAYGIFMGLVQIAAKCPDRGTLNDQKGALTPRRLSILLGAPVDLIAEAIALLESEEIGWLESHELEAFNPAPLEVPEQPTEPEPKALESAAAPKPTETNDSSTTPQSGASVAHAPTMRGPCAAHPPSYLLLSSLQEEYKTPPTPPPKRRRRSSSPAAPPGFSRFWDAYPPCERKTDPGKCLSAWILDNLEPQTDAILAGLEAWKTSRTWTKENGDFIPLPATWLNNARWKNPPGGAVSKPADPRKAAAAAWLAAHKPEAAAMLRDFRRAVPIFANCPDDELTAKPPRELVDAVEARMKQEAA